MKLKVVDLTGNVVREIDAADEVFGIEPNRPVLHQAYATQMTNRRAGAASTLRRGEVAGSTVKIRRQKGVGRSRQGSIRAPHHVGGGVAHGPRPRSFARTLPRQMRRMALRSALSSHALSGSLLVVEGLVTAEPKTRYVQDVLDSLSVERRALIVTADHDPALALAARNIATVQLLPAQNLNVVELVNASQVLMSESAVHRCEELWGGANLKPARGRRQEPV